MAKSKNSGITKQDAIIGQFKRDARSSNDNSAVAQAIRAGKKNRKPRSNQEEIRFVFGSEAHRHYLEEKRKAEAEAK